MGNTAKHNLPYPELADPADVPMDIRELAQAIDPLGVVPVGALMMWPTGAAPNTDWLLCNGNPNVLSSDYPLLVAILGETGTPAKLKIPDFRGRFPAGPGQPVGGGLNPGANDPSNGALLVPGGEGKHSLAAIESAIRNHKHGGVTGAENQNLLHTHGPSGGGVSFIGQTTAPPLGWLAGPGPQGLIGFGSTGLGGGPAHGHPFTTDDPNGGQVPGEAHENRPPFLPVSFIILGR